MVNCKPVDTPMDPNIKLLLGQGEPFSDPERYRRLVGKLNYLTITRPDIAFVVSVVSQFVSSPCDSHWNVVMQILRYIKRVPSKGLLYEDKAQIFVVMQMRIGQDLLLIVSQSLGIVFLWKEI